MKFSQVNRNEPVTLHSQVAAGTRRAIAGGEATEGERLPRAIDLATVLGVNKNTVFRGRHILRDDGVVAFTRGRGTRVVGTPAHSAQLVGVNELVSMAIEQGSRKDEIAPMILSVE
jgi:GntR family transcriptional regulator